MTIYERVKLYKSLYHGSTAPTIVSKIISDGILYINRIRGFGGY